MAELQTSDENATISSNNNETALFQVGTAGSVQYGDVYNTQTTNINFNLPNCEPLRTTASGAIAYVEYADPQPGCVHWSPAAQLKGNDGETISKLKSKLQCVYKKCILPCVNWIASRESLLMDEYYVQLELRSADGKTTRPIKVEDLFEKRDNEIPKRILLESQPGFGKTTLATKLIFDWANGKNYLKRFDIAFFIPLRQMKGKRLKEQIEEICVDLESRVSLNDGKHEKMLLVLDGFDEISPISRDNVLKVLYQFEFAETTIIVTSRPGIFPMDGEELRELFPKHPQMKKDFHHKKVTIRGIRVGDRKEFLTKFCPNRNPEKVLDKIANLPEKVEDLFSSPLLLLLVSYFINLDMTVDIESSITDLYKSLFNNLVKSSLTREGKSINDQFDLFNVKDKTSRKYQKTLQRFGTVCLTKLRNNVFTFESDELIKEIYKFGLLTKHNFIGLFNKMEHFECFHLSFMEFCIAYFAWRKCKTRWFWQNTRTELFEQIKDLARITNRTTLVGMFSSGLLQEEAVKLLSHFEAHDSYKADVDSCYYWKMVGQLKGNEELAKSVLEITDRQFYLIGNESRLFVDREFYSSVIRNGILMLKVVTIFLPEMLDCNLPVDIRIPRLEITWSEGDCEEVRRKFANYAKHIQCHRLKFEIDDNSSAGDLSEDGDDSFVLECYTLFHSIVTSLEKEFVINNYEADPAFRRSICDGGCGATKFKYVKFRFLNRCEEVEIICALLDENRVYRLNLGILKELDNDLRYIIDLAIRRKSNGKI